MINIQNILGRYKKLIPTVVIGVLLSVVFIQYSFSQTVSATDTPTLKGLTLSPLRTEIALDPGMAYSSTLTVSNSTDKPMTVDMSAAGFSVVNQQYDYAFNPDADVVKWVSFKPSEVVLKAGESKKIPYTIGVPLMAEPGGDYISLFASTSVGSSTDEAPSQQRVGSLFYLTVTGDVLGAETEVGHLISLSSPWMVSGNTTWSMALRNSGISHYRSEYKVQVNNLFGGTVADISGSALILPGTIRSISDTLPLPKLPGVYKIIYTIGLGNNHQIVEVRYMLYMPPIATLTFIAVLVTIVLWLISRTKRRKH